MKKCMILFLYLFAVCLWGNIDISTLLEQTELFDFREISSAQMFDVSGNNSSTVIVHGISNTGNNIIAELTDDSTNILLELNQSVQLFRVFSYERNLYLLTVVRDECKVGELTHHNTFSVYLYDLSTSDLVSSYTHSDNTPEDYATFYSIKNIIYREDTNLIYLPYIFDVIKKDGTTVSQGKTLVLEFNDNTLQYSNHSNLFGNQLLFTEYGNCYGLNIRKNTNSSTGKTEYINTRIYTVDPASLNTTSIIYESDEELNYADLYTFDNSILLNTHSRYNKGLLINPETKSVSLELNDAAYNNYTTINIGGVNKILGYSNSEFSIFDERTSFKLFKSELSADNTVTDIDNNTYLYNWDKDCKIFTKLNLNNTDFLPPFITNTDSLSFPVQGISNSESEMTFSLFNNTNHTLLISEISAPEGYTLGDGSFQRRAILNDIAVSPDTFTEIHVYFNPLSEGEYKGNISICTDLNGITSDSVKVSGNCVDGVVTEVTISENTVWESDTVYVSGDLAIKANAELNIKAGTTVIMAPHSELFVYGTLNIEGTDTAPVIITSSEDYWDGIRFTGESSSENTINYCHISNILSIGENNLFIRKNASVEMTNCEIRNNTVYTLEEGRTERLSAVVYVKDSNLSMRLCKIYNNTQIGAQTDYSGVMITDNSTITLDNAIFTDNTSTDNHIKLNNSQMNVINSNLIDQRIYAIKSDINFVNSIIYSEIFSSPLIIDQNCNTSLINCLLNKTASGYITASNNIYKEAVIWDNPDFIDETDVKFDLSRTSPCIDQGTDIINDYSFPYYDIDNNIRIWDGNRDSKNVIDIGVNEYFGSADDKNDCSPAEFIKTINCYPNPFNPSTHLSFNLVEDSHVNITIYNIKGQVVKTLINKRLESGFHKIEWNGLDIQSKQVSSGVYFCKFSATGVSKTVKMVLMK